MSEQARSTDGFTTLDAFLQEEGTLERTEHVAWSEVERWLNEKDSRAASTKEAGQGKRP